MGRLDQRRTSGGAIAHKVETDFTGEKVRSYPPTAVVLGRDSLAIVPDSSRGVARVPAVLGTEQLGRHLGADPGPVLSGHRVVARVPERGVVVLDPLGDLDLKRARLGRVDLERQPQPSRRAEVPLG